MCKLSEDQLEEISNRVAGKLKSHRSRAALTPEDITAIKAFINTKKSAVKIVLYIAGVMAIWALKDIYMYIVETVRHLKVSIG